MERGVTSASAVDSSPCSRPELVIGRVAVFPHFICRISGLPAGSVDRLRADRCLQIVSKLLSIEQDIATGRDQISAILHTAIGGLEDQRARRALLQLRRHLYNGRCWSDPELGALKSYVAAQGWGDVVAFNGLVAARSALVTDLRESYRSDVAAIRRQIRRLVGQQDFQKGLMLSSEVLFEQLQRYLRSCDVLTAQEERIERGILRYLTRMATKATPFGAFCTVLAGRVIQTRPGGASNAGGMALRGHLCAKESRVRLNKASFEFSWSTSRHVPW